MSQVGGWIRHGQGPKGIGVIDTQGMSPGHKLGRYELLVPIAQGGMATIWAARLRGPRGFSKMVAVKAMLQSLSDDPQFEQMFLAEAKLAARIRHPNVCEIFDLGEQDGILYIAMEWIEGEPLGVLLRLAARRNGVPMAIAARIGAAAALGLHAAHELTDETGQVLGLVHRDVSPQNILVTYEGAVKIVDFGVAKATAAQSVDAPKTKIGDVKGTLTFMPPEQASSGAVDRRSDIFSLGVVLYYLISGVHPFKAENEYLTLGRILSPVPALPLSSVNARCPPGLNAAVMKAMEKRPENRFATMADFAKALQRAAGEAMALDPTGDIGAFVRDLAADRRERRAQAIRDTERLIEEREAAGIGGPLVGAPQMRLTLPSVDTTNSATLARAVTATPTSAVAGVTAIGAVSDGGMSIPPPRRSQKTALIVAGSLVLLAAGTVGAIRALGPAASDSPPVRPAGSNDGDRPVLTAAPTASASATAPATAEPTATASSSAKPRSPGGSGPAKPKEPGAPVTNLPKLTDPGF